MRYPAPLVVFLSMVFLTGGSSAPDSWTSDIANIEVQVTAGPARLAGALVALDLNNNGIWDEHLAEPYGWTDDEGIVVFDPIVSIDEPDHGNGDGGGGQAGVIDRHSSRILTGNLRGTVGARDVYLDFVLPRGSSAVSLGLYDLKGRRLAETQGVGDLALYVSGGLPSGVYFLRLSASPAAPVSQRITSVGVRTQVIMAHQVTMDEAIAAGWAVSRLPGQNKTGGVQHRVNIIVDHDHYPSMVQPEIIEPGMNYFTVDLGPAPPDGFVYIPFGTFMMGSPLDEPGRYADRETLHEVTLTRGFFMSVYEVTEEWWDAVMGTGGSTSRLPRNYLSWDQAVLFCNTLSLQEGLDPVYTVHGNNGHVSWDQSADGYRLPTEAEWEYACRATTALAYHNNTNCLFSDDEANFRGNADQLPGCSTGVYRAARTDVGSFPPNEWGLYDMHGNLLEWVWDGYRADYENLDSVDPIHDVNFGQDRVIRGGHWYSSASNCRSALRNYGHPDNRYFYYGFRPVRTVF